MKLEIIFSKILFFLFFCKKLLKYGFKFILKNEAGELEILKSILENHKGNLSQKSSTNNKFISVTFKYLASSPSDVIKIYKEASVIDDIIIL